MTHPTLKQTEALVKKAFEGKEDRGGNPMFTHMSRVVLGVCDQDEATQHVAWLHDLIEDTKTTIYDLAEMGYTSDILEAVELLTHNKKEMKYPEYIDRICTSGNRYAIFVKLSDQRDNLDPSRWMQIDNRYVQNALRKKYAGVQGKLMKAAVEL